MDANFYDMSEEMMRRYRRCISSPAIHTYQSDRQQYRLYLGRIVIERFALSAMECHPRALLWEPLGKEIIAQKMNRAYRQSPWMVPEPPKGIFPPYVVSASVSSGTSIAGNSGHGSSLVVVWFAEEVSDNHLAELTRLLQGINWEQQAKDYAFDS